MSAPQREALLDELALYLRPPGQGIHTVSSGKQELLAKTRAYLGESWNPDRPWRDQLERVVGAKFAMLAIPSDTGAGIVRGAARGPEAIRAELARVLGRAPVLDLGDVFSIPQLLDEEMLSDTARARCQDAVWPELPEARRRALPVSPLGMAERVRRLLLELAPRLRLLMLGGDHTVTWPVLAPLLEGPTEDLGLVHFDAHTDLLPERLGIRYCFATWAYHANLRLGGERLIQIGIRASGRSREHWEQTQGVKQIWAEQARALEPHALARLVVDHLESRGVSRVYISNDIDGTDVRFAAACGTPEPDGLLPDHVLAVTEAVGECFHVIGADLVELAPGLSLDANLAEISVRTAFQYVQGLLSAMRAHSAGTGPGAGE